MLVMLYKWYHISCPVQSSNELLVSFGSDTLTFQFLVVTTIGYPITQSMNQSINQSINRFLSSFSHTLS